MTYKKSSKSTSSITPNWFKSGVINSPQSQENQFSSTRGLRYGPLRINKTGIFVNNGTLDSTIITETGFHGYGLTGNEQITLDASTGLNITDGSNSVLQAVISGSNIGDVIMGAYSGGAGVFYDKSASKFYIKGTLEAVDGTFSGTLSAATGSFSGSVTATSGTIGGWSIGATSFYSTDVTLSSASGGALVIGSTSTTGIGLLKVGGVPYISFISGGSAKGLLAVTTAGSGGINLVGGDFVLDNNKSILIADTTYGSSKYGGIGITNGNQFWLTLGTDNTFYMKNNAQDDNYFTVSSSQAYHKAKFAASEGSFTTENSTTINNTTLNGNTIYYWNLNYYSDKSVKKNILKLKTDFDKLSQLESVEFKYKNDTKNKKHFGFIAQDLEKIYPDLVSTDENGIKSTDITQLIPLLVNAVNDLNSEINNLKLKVYN